MKTNYHYLVSDVDASETIFDFIDSSFEGKLVMGNFEINFPSFVSAR